MNNFSLQYFKRYHDQIAFKLQIHDCFKQTLYFIMMPCVIDWSVHEIFVYITGQCVLYYIS